MSDCYEGCKRIEGRTTLKTIETLPDGVLVEISRTVHESKRLILNLGSAPLWRCHACGCQAPMPDDKAAAFMLDHADGGRICFPNEETAEPERDVYPVTGWIRLTDRTGVKYLFCDTCGPVVASAMTVAINTLKASAKDDRTTK